MPNRLRESRQMAHLTQEQAAKALGVTSRALSNYERGVRHPDIRIVAKMTEVYGVSADQLVGRAPLIAND